MDGILRSQRACIENSKGGVWHDQHMLFRLPIGVRSQISRTVIGTWTIEITGISENSNKRFDQLLANLKLND